MLRARLDLARTGRIPDKDHTGTMRLTLTLATAFGAILIVGLVAFYGWTPILMALQAVGWGVVPVSLVRIAEAAAAAVCWWLLLERRNWTLLRACLLLRWVREAVNVLLPVAQVGGEVVGARLLTFFGVSGSLSSASVLVDLLAQTVTQFFFTLVGLALLATVGGADTLVRWVAMGLAVMAPALVGFFLAQRYGGARLLEKVLRRFTDDPQWAAIGGGLAALNQHMVELYRRPERLALVFVIHFATWFLGVFEIWFALRFMGYPVSYAHGARHREPRPGRAGRRLRGAGRHRGSGGRVRGAVRRLRHSGAGGDRAVAREAVPGGRARAPGSPGLARVGKSPHFHATRRGSGDSAGHQMRCVARPRRGPRDRARGTPIRTRVKDHFCALRNRLQAEA